MSDDRPLRVFICTDHQGHWPVGVASVVLAPTEAAAYELLKVALQERHLDKEPFTLEEIPPMVAAAYILCDGNY